MQELLEQMAGRVMRHTDGMSLETPLPRVAIGYVRPGGSLSFTGCASGVCLVIQGSKQMTIGGKTLRGGPGSCFASLFELPDSRVTYKAAGARPYVTTALRLEPELLGELVRELPAITSSSAGYSAARVSHDVLEAWDRLLALLDAPQDLPVLRAGRERELLYRLLQSPVGPVLRQLAQEEARLAHVQRAIDWMRRNIATSIASKELAAMVGMSVPSFNRHFRRATSTSPLQYHKTLRLHAARRLLATNVDATRVAFAVGYESPSQFSREYTRLFGQPPKRDAGTLREASIE